MRKRFARAAVVAGRVGLASQTLARQEWKIDFEQEQQLASTLPSRYPRRHQARAQTRTQARVQVQEQVLRLW